MKFFNEKNVLRQLDNFKNIATSKNEELSEELTEEQENILENNLIWIFSPPRSGTTWLMELMSDQCHPIDEPLIGYHVIGSSRDQAVKNRLIDDHKIRKDYFFSEKYKNTWKFYLRKLILMRFFAQVQDISKKVVIKEPNGSMGADVLLDCLPNSKFILLMRDGRDVIDSLMDARMEDSWASTNVKNTEESRLNFIKQQSNVWIKHITVLLDIYNKFPNDQKYFLKYEDLKRGTQKEMEKLCKFFNLSTENLEKTIKKYDFENLPSFRKGKTKPRRFATPGKWKENLSEKEQNELNRIVLPKLKELGYE